MHTPAPRTLPQRITDVTYPGGAEHIRAVHADLRAVLEDCPRADDVILCASELAANAALHSRSRLPGGTFMVRAIVNPDLCARIEVQDDGGPWNQGMIDPTRHHGLTSFAPSPTSGASTETKPAALSGRDSSGLSNRGLTASRRSDSHHVMCHHVSAVRIFFTIIKGAPPARRA